MMVDANSPRVRKFHGLNFLGMITVFKREMKREWRFFGVTMIGPALQTALFATVFTLAAAGNLNEMNGLPYVLFLAPGLVISVGLQRAFESTAFGLMEDKLEGTLGDLLGAPLYTLEIMLGQAMSSLLITTLISASVWAVMLPFGIMMPANPFWMAGYFLVGALMFSTMGILAAMISPKWDSLAGKETFIVMPLTFLSGTFFSIDVVPEYFQPWFKANPVYHVIDGFRNAVTGGMDETHISGFIYAACVAVCLWFLCLTLYSRGYKLKD